MLPRNTTVVILPTFNEIENLRTIVERTITATIGLVDILIVDDNSPDGTGELAATLAEELTVVHYMPRERKAGLGIAYLAGFAWALELGYGKIFEMDADGSHPPECLPTMIELLDVHDVVVGSRWMLGGRTENWPLSRALMSRGANLYARTLLGLSVHDATGGFRGFTAAALRELELDTVRAAGYVFQVDLVQRALTHGLDVVEPTRR